MNKTHVVWGFLILLVLSACETVLDYELPKQDPKLVVNCFIHADSSWQASVSESKGILNDGELKFLPNAVLEVFEDGNHIGTLAHNQGGQYSNSWLAKPVPGKDYRVNVSAPGYDAVTSTASLPGKVLIQRVDTSTEEIQGFPYFKIQIGIQDPGDETNYYGLELTYFKRSVVYPDSSMVAETLRVEYPLYFFSNEADFSEGLTNTLTGSVFNDELFDGKKYSVSVLTDFGERGAPPDSATAETVLDEKVTVELRTLSEAYYLYTTSFEKQQQAKYDPFAQPVQVFNNIEGGYGIFAGYSTDTQEITLK